jgi:hypothetical protein
VTVVVAGDCFAPELYDPEYSARLTRLQAQRAEHPDERLFVMLGSSRTTQLFRPERLPALTAADGRKVLPFNFSRSGGGPVYSRLAFSRLCQLGLKPDWVVVELMPALLTNRYERFFYTGVTASELSELARYISGRRAIGFYAKLRLLAGYKNRVALLRKFAPSWVIPMGDNDPALSIDELGGEGRRIRPKMDAAVQHAEDVRVSTAYGQILADYKIDPGADRAFRDLLRSCKEAGVGVVVLRTPESSTFRAVYQPSALTTLDAYLADLMREYAVRVVDAREWLPDNEFEDGHHPLLPGQTRFTDRLYGEVLVPLVSGQFK